MAFPATFNFNYYRGDTFELIVSPKTSSGDPYAIPVGYSAYLDIATKRAATEPSDWIGRIPCTIDSESRTEIGLLITSTTGANMVAGTSYVYDLEITNGTNVYTLMTGSITVTDNVRAG